MYFNDKDLDVTQNKRQKSKYETHIEPVFGNTNIKLLKRNNITEFRNKILKEGKANNTVNGIVILLNAIINYAIKEKEIVNGLYS